MSNERQAALHSWDRQVSTLTKAVGSYEGATRTLADVLKDENVSVSLEDAYSRIDLLNSRLESLEMRLRTARASLLAERNKSVKLVPINRLHPELLSMIFQIGAEDELHQHDDMSDTDSVLDDKPKRTFAVIMTEVCQFWKAVATGTATLWNKIDFSEGPPFTMSKLALERSKQSNLDIAFRLSDVHQDEHLSQALKILQPHIERINVLSVETTSHNQLTHILSFILLNQPSPHTLKSLTLIDEQGDGEAVLPSNLRGHSASELNGLVRSVETLVLEGVHLLYQSAAYHGLKTLRLVNQAENWQLTSVNLRDILEASPDLETFEMDTTGVIITSEDENDAPSGEPLVMRSLTTLSLSTFYIPQMEYVLRLITAPSLESFTLIEPERPIDDEMDMDEPETPGGGVTVDGVPRTERLLQTFGKLLTRSFTSPSSSQPTSSAVRLKHLVLDTLDIAPDTHAIVHLLSLIPSLQTLELTGMELDDTILQSMTVPTSIDGPGNMESDTGPSATEVIIPCLRSLRLESMESFSPEALKRMCRSRKQAEEKGQSDVKKLEVLKLVECTYDEQPLKGQLEACVGLLVWKSPSGHSDFEDDDLFEDIDDSDGSDDDMDDDDNMGGGLVLQLPGGMTAQIMGFGHPHANHHHHHHH